MILKRSRGAAGADHFVLITSACPRIGINDAGDTIIKVTIIAVEDRYLPALDLWKYVIVRTGSVQPTLLQ